MNGQEEKIAEEASRLSQGLEKSKTYSSIRSLDKYLKDKSLADFNRKSDQNANIDATDRKGGIRKKINEKCQCSSRCWLNLLLSFFPFLYWVREYDWKKDIINDVLAGITIGIMSIPQGISYAGVAGVPAVFGLYSNLVPTTLYFFLGTSRLAAIGPAAVLCIMVGSTRHKHIPNTHSDLSAGCVSPESLSLLENNTAFYQMYTNGTGNRKQLRYDDSMGSRIFENPDCFTSWQLVIAMTMLTGFILITMGILHLGFVSNYLSDSLVGGFTSGAAIHVLTSQLDYVFGLHLPWHSGIGRLIFAYTDLFMHMSESIRVTLIISAMCVCSLMLIKEVLNPKFQRALGAPFPGELILIIIGTLISYFGQFEKKYDVEIVHSITAGFPLPIIPRFDLMKRVALDSCALAVVLYCLSISLAKLYAKRNGYKIDPNQEFFAYGLINAIGSIFQCFASGQVVSRSIVYESSGAKSQFAGMLGSILVLITILWIAPLLAALPKCILGSIIIVSCIQMLKQLKQLKTLYLVSKIEFIIYVFTFTAVLILDVIEGLAASVAFATLVGLIRSQWPKIKGLFKLGTNQGKDDAQTPDIRIFRFDEPLDFNGADRFKRLLYELCNIDPDEVHTRTDTLELHTLSMSITETTDSKSEIAVIIDCSSFHYVDSMGIRALREVDIELQKRRVQVYYAECTGDNLETLQLSKFFNTDRECRRFETIQAALTSAECSKNQPVGKEEASIKE